MHTSHPHGYFIYLHSVQRVPTVAPSRVVIREQPKMCQEVVPNLESRPLFSNAGVEEIFLRYMSGRVAFRCDHLYP